MALMCCSRKCVDFAVMVVLLGLVQESKQLSRSHPMREIVDKVNEDGGPYIGLVMAYPTEQLALQNSGFFLPDSDIPWIDLAGRRFNIGKINGVNVIYVMTGEQTVRFLHFFFDL